MRCPYCSNAESKVYDTRTIDDGDKVRRRRECLKCGRRFTTYEAVELMPIFVVKRDSSREPFSRNKLMSGLMRACEKRPVPLETIEGIVKSIQITLQSSADHEVKASVIGEMAMSALKQVDEVSYVRFASVYRQFKDINSFIDELNSLKKRTEPTGKGS